MYTIVIIRCIITLEIDIKFYIMAVHWLFADMHQSYIGRKEFCFNRKGEGMKCPNCGNIVFEGTIRCDRCGTVLSGSRQNDPSHYGRNNQPGCRGPNQGFDQDFYRDQGQSAHSQSDLPPHRKYANPPAADHISFKDSDQAARQGGSGKAIIIAVVAVVILIAAGVAGFFIYRSFQGDKTQEAKTDKSSAAASKKKDGNSAGKTYKNTVDEPEQQYWVVYDGGEEMTQWEMASVNAEGSRDNLKVIWNDGGSLTLDGDQSHSDFNRYRNTSDGEFDLQGSYDSFTSYAYSVLASNLNVYDTNGNLIVEASDWDDTPWGRLVNGAPHDEYENDANPDDFLTEENFRNQVDISAGDIIYFIKEDFNGDGRDEAYVITGEENEFTGYNNVNIYYMSGVSGECRSMLEDGELTMGYLHEDSSGNPALISAGHHKYLVWEKYAGGSGSLSFLYGVRDPEEDGSESQPYMPEISGQYEDFGLYSREYAELCEMDYEPDREGDYVSVESYYDEYHKHRPIFLSFDEDSGEFYVDN